MKNEHSFQVVLRVGILAELSRHGIAMPEAKTLLVDEVQRDLCEQLLRSGPSPKPRYLFADQMLTSGADGALHISRGRPFEGLRPYFTRMADDDHECATAIVIDTAKLLRRILKNLRAELEDDVPDPFGRTYPTAVVAAVAGANASTVRAWLARGLLEEPKR